MASAFVSRDLPMPNVTLLTTLNQAHATLLHCWNKLTRLTETCAILKASRAHDDMITEERKQVESWLDRWEQAFTEFLSSAMASMGTDELTLCRVLKANHLSSTIVAAELGPGGADLDAFEPEFQAILELSDAVLKARQGTRSPQSTTSSPIASPATAGLDVLNPLHVVAAHCNKLELRQRANELLLRECRR